MGYKLPGHILKGRSGGPVATVVTTVGADARKHGLGRLRRRLRRTRTKVGVDFCFGGRVSWGKVLIWLLVVGCDCCYTYLGRLSNVARSGPDPRSTAHLGAPVGLSNWSEQAAARGVHAAHLPRDATPKTQGWFKYWPNSGLYYGSSDKILGQLGQFA